MFNKGDKVKRVNSEHIGMRVGDTATVKNYKGQYNMELNEYSGMHDPRNFELVKEENKMKFDMKVNSWIIYVNSKEQFEVVRDWIKTQGIKFEHGEDWQAGMIAVGAAKRRQAYCQRIHPDDHINGLKEIVLNFKTIVDSVKWPEVESEARKELAKLQQQIEELSAQAEKLKASL